MFVRTFLFFNFYLILIIAKIELSKTFPFLEDCEILDLTHEFSNETKYWGGMDKFKLDTVFKGVVNSGNYFYEAFKFSAAEHGGTHLDAPAHFSQIGLSTEKVPIKNLIGEACVVDVSAKVKINHDYQLTVADLEEWEKVNGNLNERCILLMRTGWDAKYANSTSYFGTATPADPKTYHFPGLAPEAAKWLVDTNRLKAFGLDTPSVDYGPTVDFKTHQILNDKNISGMENLMFLDKLPLRRATIVALPMKVKDGSGGPLRVIAVGWNGQNDPCIRNLAGKCFISCFLLLMVLTLEFFYC